MRRAAAASVAVAALVAALSIALAWWVGQTAFLRWALDHAVISSGGRLKAEGLGGTLFEGLAIGTLQWTEPAAPGARTGLSVTLHDLRVDASPWRLLRRELLVTQASAARVSVVLPASDAPATLPADLSLPLAVSIGDLRIGALSIEPEGVAAVVLQKVSLRGGYRPNAAGTPATGTPATGTDATQIPVTGGVYTLERLTFESAHGRAELTAHLADAAPFALDARARATLAWRALPLRARASGTLHSFALRVEAGSIDGASTGVTPGVTADAQPSARADTRVRPLDAMALGPIDLTVQGVTADWLGLPPAWAAQIDGSAHVVPSLDPGGRVVAHADLRLRNARAGRVDEHAIPLASLAGHLRWDGARLAIDRVDAVAPGDGRVRGAIVYDPAASLEVFGRSLPRIDLDLTVDALDLARLDARLPPSRMAGTARLDARTVDVALADAGRGGARFEARASLEAGRLVVERARLAAWPGVVDGVLTLSGTTALDAPHLARLEGSFAGIDPAGLIRLPTALGLQPEGRSIPDTLKAALDGSLDGTWQLDGPLRFGPDDPPIAVALTLARGRLAGQPVSGRLQARMARAGVRDVVVSLAAGDARLDAQGALGMPADSLRFRLRAPSMASLAALSGVAELASAKGALNAEGELRGRLDGPALTLQADLDRLDIQGRVRARTLSLRADLPPSTGALATARLALRLDLRDLIVGAVRADRVHLDAEGSIGAHGFTLAVDAPRGSLRAQGSGGVSFDDPAMGPRWLGSLQTLRTTGDLEARLAEPTRIDLRPGAFAIEQATLTSDLGTVKLARAQWRDGRFSVAGELTVAPTRPGRLARLLDALGMAPVEARAGFDPDNLRVHARLDLSGSGLTDASGMLNVRAGEEGRTDATGEADLTIDNGRMTGPLQVAIPSLAFANRLIGPAWTIDGRLKFAGRMGGTLTAPRLDGTLSGADLRLQQAAMGWRLHGGTLSGRFDGERFRLDSLKLFTGQPASGSVELAGQVRVADREGAFTMTADRLAVPIGPGQRVVMSGLAELTSRGGAFDVKGSLRADEGLIELRGGDAPTLPADVVVAGRTPAAAGSPTPTDTQRMRIAADIALELGEQLRVRGSGIDARLTGRLNLRGTLPEAPRAFGTVRIRDGRYSAYGQQLEITQGRVVFNGAIDNPQLDIVALRRNQTVEAGVALTGTVLSPRVRLTSQPEVPDAEKLSWLVLGVALDSAQAGAQGAALQAAAASLFGSNDGGLAGSLAQALGLDSIALRGATGASGLTASGFGGTGFGTSLPPIPGQVGGGLSAATTGGAVGDNVVSIGKRLGSRLYVTYEQGLRGVWNLLRVQYDITERLSLRGQAGSESALDLLYRYSFD